jgi:hypothetical protein
MKLNRNNYEEYFILYLDNELASEDRREVETFIKENPDLKAELDMLLQSKLSPDTDLSFSNKEILMARDSSSINLTNYEQWLLCYIDDELTKEERKDVEQFVSGNPSIQTELGLLQKIKMQPEAIVFPYKESLYHKEEKTRVITIRWWRLAAAAVLLLGVSTTAIILLNKKPVNVEGGVVKTQAKTEKSTDNTPVEQANVTRTNQEQVAITDPKKTNPAIKETNPAIAHKEKNVQPKEKNQLPLPEKNETLIANNDIQNRPTNDLPQPTVENIYVSGKNGISNTAGQTTELSENSSLTNSNEKAKLASVTDEPLQPSYAVEQSSEKKNKLRGFFRKITRTFEKRTNIKATNDDDRLLIAGLSIKLN